VLSAEAQNIEKGKKLFSVHCAVCHENGKNIILYEKDLSKETLRLNGMNTKEAITYLIVNGKNGMPAFGGRLHEIDIDNISDLLLECNTF